MFSKLVYRRFTNLGTVKIFTEDEYDQQLTNITVPTYSETLRSTAYPNGIQNTLGP